MDARGSKMGQWTQLGRLKHLAVVTALPALVLTACGGGGAAALKAGAQITTASTASQIPPTSFTAADAHFSAVFPTPPTRTASTHMVGGVSEPVIAYEGDTTTEKLDLGYLPLPGPPQAASVAPALDASINDGAASNQGTVTSRQRITYLGSPAEDATFQSPVGTFHERVVVIGRAFYVLKGLTPTTNAPHPQYDEMLASFRVG